MNKIIVGVDGSDGGRRALRWAIREAADTGVSVEAVTAWHWAGVQDMTVPVTGPDEQRTLAERGQSRDIAAIRAELDDAVPVTRVLVRGVPAEVLADAARGARLLVLGSHGHGRLHHAVLGSVAEECVRLAACPVVIVPVPHAKPFATSGEAIATTG
ncbi:universal stress protein [Virgisporangium aliadipatigenens]|uniref:Universal stress protein n=1 Tax=Virgisporangium aliadipatigenens TaxID=741659 RepID=A0A8J3YGH5_9ACTN|nr:universal stress protein [Virgisporangium aliadipatigenens]GIJ43625.1 universal stress protein [Virgisporangium aliadipatigenens]